MIDFRYMKKNDYPLYKDQIFNLMLMLSNDKQYYKEKIDKLYDYICDGSAYVALAIENEKLIGFNWFYIQNNTYLHITHFVVDSNYQKKGIGKRLFHMAKRYAIENEITNINLNVDSTNQTAISFYLNEGLKPQYYHMNIELARPKGLAKDIYFEEGYGSLYNRQENGKYQIFIYEDENGRIEHSFILRKIEGTEYCDLITPYGYGGPLIIKLIGNKNLLLERFHFSFMKYVKDNNVISEFIRFHPLLQNADDFKKIYPIEFVRNTCVTELIGNQENVRDYVTKKCYKRIKHCIKIGMDFEIETEPDSIDDFIDIYYSTMKRNEADEYYYFDKQYFETMLKKLRKYIITVKIKYENKTIAMGLYFLYGDTIHIHLSGTLSEYIKLSPAYMLRYAIIKWGIQHEYRFIHHGGGRSNSLEDGLYVFKKQFSNKEEPFYIAKKIWNEEVYHEMSNQKDTDFFPAYRVKKDR